MKATAFICLLAMPLISAHGELLPLTPLPFISTVNDDLLPDEPMSSKIYYFSDGDECVDTCETRGGYAYKWCNTVSNSWRECSESGENSLGGKCVDGGCNENDRCYGNPSEKCSLTRPRKALYTTIADRRCLSECVKHQKTDYNWCRYWQGNKLTWDKCSAIEGHTVTDRKCKGPCTYRKNYIYSNKYMCEREDGSEEECSPVESIRSCVVRNYDRSILLGFENAQFDMSGAGGPICFVTSNANDDHKRRKRSRQSVADICWNARNSLMCGDDETLQNMRNARDALVMSSNMFTRPTPGVGDLLEIRPNNDDNPVISALRRQIRPDVFRTEYIEADIYNRHVGRPRQPFTSPTTTIEYFRTQLNALLNDDRGHLVPAAVGGVPEDYNAAPQNLAVNRPGGGYLQTLWSVMERRMREFFQTGGPGANGDGHIQYRVMLDYPNETTGRPSAFWVVVNFIFPNAEHNTYYHLIEIYVVNNIIIRRVGNDN